MWLYDPRTNILKQMSLREIGDICGTDFSNVSKKAKRGGKIRQIGCYVFKDKPTLATRRGLYEIEEFQGEIWRQYENTYYEVSNFGRVRRNYKTTSSLVMPYIKDKYMTVKLNLDNKVKEHRLRSIVAKVYLKPEPNKTCLIHKNGDYTDCSVWNIERAVRSTVARKSGGKARSKPVVLIDETTQEIINWWPSARKTAKAVFMGYQSINDRCNGLVKSRKEGYFMWEEDYEKLVETAV